jgi:PadR family transcriptional regulator AphA
MDAKTLCLGILIKGDASGYEIRKAFEDGPFNHFFDVGFGSIYPALTRLADEGLVSYRAEAQEKRPAKKVYSITAEGRMAFIETLKEPLGRDKIRSEFLFLMSFADLLPARHVEQSIDSRIAQLREKIEHMESGTCAESDYCHRFVHGFGLALYRAMADYLEENRHVLVGEVLKSESDTPEVPLTVAAAQ